MPPHPPPHRLPIPTALGDFIAHYSACGLCGLDLPCRGGLPSPAPAHLAATSEIRRWHVLTAKALAAALHGLSPARLPPLDLTKGTLFQQSVWHALLGIAPGQTRSYGQIAAAIGRPKAARAVGAACGANPVALLIPCHRVLASGGGLGGFSGGLDWKILLLDLEQLSSIALS